ncbi:MAG TPA: protein kinase [Candidatus Saccharimonadales bacterium]|nr:protein kinase [Candidatus Saccharimonadales bacterium]
MIGKRIAHYSITAKLGEGGMGEVYQATDTKLNREVALKILPQAFATDGERMVRFEREAQVLASLNHPNIGTIHGIEEFGGSKALVLELVEGPTLADRVARGPVPPGEALEIAVQIADALDAAHSKGVVHRDLKPANIKLTAEGRVKVLDFGLARVTEPDADTSANDLSRSPTMTSPATRVGVIMGTAAYMAPEQAKGRAVDKRADIWAFGVILYQMLAGRAPFRGEDFSEILAAVLATSPDLTRLPETTPPAMVRVIRRCLERDPRERLRDIGDARHELMAPEEEPGKHDETLGAPARFASRPALLVMGALALVAAALGLLWAWSAGRIPAAQVARASIALPPGHVLVAGPEITRDGERIAFVSRGGSDRPRIYTRKLDEEEPKPLEGTEEATQIFFSPDGRWIGFYARGGLYKVNVSGGAPIQLAKAASSMGGAWLEDGTIVFTPAWNGGLYRIADNGGDPEPLLIPDGKTAYAYVWPKAIPGGKQILFTLWGKTWDNMLLDLATMKQTLLVPGSWHRSAYVEPGYILSASEEGDLLAIPGDPVVAPGASSVPVLSHVDPGGNGGYSRFSVSSSGTLVYAQLDPSAKSLVFVDQEGRTTTADGTARAYGGLSVSPDGRRVAYDSAQKIYVQDLHTGTRIPLAHDLSASQDSPVWSPDGKRVIFESNHEGTWDIYSKSASDSGELEALVHKPYDQNPESMTPDGTLIFGESNPQTGEDIWLLPPGGEAVPWLATPASEKSADASPDGRLVAFVSDVAERDEVYVQPLKGDGERIAVSTSGGISPRWDWSGRRLYFRSNNRIMFSEITTEPRLAASEPVELLDGGWELGYVSDTWYQSYDSLPDGRLLMVLNHPAAIPTKIGVIFDWFEDLRARVKAAR